MKVKEFVPRGNYILVKLLPEPKRDVLLPDGATMLNQREGLVVEASARAFTLCGVTVLFRRASGIEVTFEDTAEDAEYLLLDIDDVFGWAQPDEG